MKKRAAPEPCSEGFRHATISDGVFAFGDFSTAGPDGKDLEEAGEEFVATWLLEVGVGLSQAVAVFFPDGDGFASGTSGRRYDVGVFGFPRNAEVTLEFISFARWHSCQGSDCGKCRLK